MLSFPELFEPGRIGGLELKNRIIMAPMFTHLCSEDETVNDRLVDYYVERARGGCGLVTVEAAYSRPYPAHLGLYDDRFIPGLKKLSDAIRREGARACIQINTHRGRADETDPATASPSIHPKTGARARALTTEDIAELTEQFGRAAKRARDSGFDCVMIHGGTGYLISEFLSARINKRTDGYGGDITGRARLALELAEAAKKCAGASYPVIFRLAAHERLAGGYGVEEAVAVCKLLEKVGVDAIDITSGVAETQAWNVPYMYMPPACNASLSQAVKAATSIPISTVGKINDPSIAEEVLQHEKADFVTMGRALIADPEFPNKAREGRAGEIRKCIACCRCIETLFGAGARPVVCAVNPAAGREREFQMALGPASQKKRVLVVGGGPGGMEAAMVAAQRGHSVALWEKGNELGGQLLLGSKPPGKGEIGTFIEHLGSHLDRLGVEVTLGKEATAQTIGDFGPDAVILAVGSKPLIPKIAGAEEKKPIVFDAVLSGKADLGKRVVVIGGGSVGCETAHLLADQGKKTTVVEILPKLASDLFYAYGDLLVKTLEESGVDTFVGVREETITQEGVSIVTKEGKRILVPADSIVIATGSVSNKALFESIKGTVDEIYQIGDCVDVRRIQEATSEGAEAALRV
ncbi:FAD-dependent oxidoreductase [Chloroflexota bacterium]